MKTHMDREDKQLIIEGNIPCKELVYLLSSEELDDTWGIMAINLFGDDDDLSN